MEIQGKHPLYSTQNERLRHRDKDGTGHDAFFEISLATIQPLRASPSSPR
jgi:hypothetical protein